MRSAVAVRAAGSGIGGVAVVSACAMHSTSSLCLAKVQRLFQNVLIEWVQLSATGQLQSTLLDIMLATQFDVRRRADRILSKEVVKLVQERLEKTGVSLAHGQHGVARVNFALPA
jgi:hypothetical protein